jgi:hypothetical protein
MWLVFLGFAISLAYGVFGATLIYFMAGRVDAQRFLVLFIGPFNTLVSLGLITGTALVVSSAQSVIPKTIEAAFTTEELASTSYFANRKKFFSVRRTITFASEFIVIGFVIFTICKFPLSGIAEDVMIAAACTQWALATYVGRKLRYAGQMLYSLLDAKHTRNLFAGRELDLLNTSIHIASTLTIIWLYLHIRSYYTGPFQYTSLIGHSAQVFLLLPGVLATPVILIFNFFPRVVLRRIYSKSIEIELDALQVLLHSDALSEFEKKLRLMGFDKMYRDELRYNLQLTLADLPIGLTLIVMLLQPFLKS